MIHSAVVDEVLDLLGRMHAAHQEAATCAARIQRLLLEPGVREPLEAEQRLPLADAATMSIYWNDQVCHIPSQIRFRLFQRLARRPNFFVTYRQLQLEVWDGDQRCRSTLRGTVRQLRRDLRAGGMHDLADAIRGKEQRYGLILNGRS